MDRHTDLDLVKVQPGPSSVAFEPLEGALVDPERQLRLMQGRWEPESRANGGSQAIILEWDPEMRRDNLWRQLSASERHRLSLLYPRHEMALPTHVPNRSIDSIEVVHWLVDLHRIYERLEIEITATFVAAGASLQRLRNAGLNDDLTPMIQAAMASIPKIPRWQQDMNLEAGNIALKE